MDLENIESVPTLLREAAAYIRDVQNEKEKLSSEKRALQRELAARDLTEEMARKNLGDSRPEERLSSLLEMDDDDFERTQQLVSMHAPNMDFAELRQKQSSVSDEGSASEVESNFLMRLHQLGN